MPETRFTARADFGQLIAEALAAREALASMNAEANKGSGGLRGQATELDRATSSTSRYGQTTHGAANETDSFAGRIDRQVAALRKANQEGGQGILVADRYGRAVREEGAASDATTASHTKRGGAVRGAASETDKAEASTRRHTKSLGDNNRASKDAAEGQNILSRAAKSLDNTFNDTSRDSSNFSRILVNLITTTLPALLPFFAALIAGAGGLVTMITALTAGFGAFGLLAAVSLGSTSKSFTNLQKAIDKLPPALAPIRDQLKGIISELQGMGDQFRPQLIGNITGFFTNLRVMLQQTLPFAREASKAFDDLNAVVAAGLRSGAYQQFVSLLQRQIRPAIDALGTGIFNLIRTFAGIAVAFEGSAKGIESGLIRITNAMAHWAETLPQREGFQKFMAFVSDNGPLMKQTLHDVGQALGAFLDSVGRITQYLTPAVLFVVDKFAQVLAGLLRTPFGDFFVSMILFSKAISSLGGLAAFVLGPIGGLATGIGRLVAAVKAMKEAEAGVLSMQALSAALGALTGKGKVAEETAAGVERLGAATKTAAATTGEGGLVAALGRLGPALAGVGPEAILVAAAVAIYGGAILDAINNNNKHVDSIHRTNDAQQNAEQVTRRMNDAQQENANRAQEAANANNVYRDAIRDGKTPAEAWAAANEHISAANRQAADATHANADAAHDAAAQQKIAAGNVVEHNNAIAGQPAVLDLSTDALRRNADGFRKNIDAQVQMNKDMAKGWQAAAIIARDGSSTTRQAIATELGVSIQDVDRIGKEFNLRFLTREQEQKIIAKTGSAETREAIAKELNIGVDQVDGIAKKYNLKLADEATVRTIQQKAEAGETVRQMATELNLGVPQVEAIGAAYNFKMKGTMEEMVRTAFAGGQHSEIQMAQQLGLGIGDIDTIGRQYNLKFDDATTAMGITAYFGAGKTVDQLAKQLGVGVNDIIIIGNNYARQLAQALNPVLQGIGLPGVSSQTAPPDYNPSALTHGFFSGGVANKPMFMVGEEAPQWPEIVLASNPAYRDRNLGYFALAGKMLGVPGFQGGGIWDPNSLPKPPGDFLLHGNTPLSFGLTGDKWANYDYQKALAWMQQQQAMEQVSNALGGIGPAVSGQCADWIRQGLAWPGHGSIGFGCMMARTMNESGCNPRAVNHWDSNAARGTPSGGLEQFIMPTFQSQACPGCTDFWNPVCQVCASSKCSPGNCGNGGYGCATGGIPKMMPWRDWFSMLRKGSKDRGHGQGKFGDSTGEKMLMSNFGVRGLAKGGCSGGCGGDCAGCAEGGMAPGDLLGLAVGGLSSPAAKFAVGMGSAPIRYLAEGGSTRTNNITNNIYNPAGETAEDSLSTAITKLSYRGVLR